MQDWIRYSSGIGFVGLEDKEEALVVGCGESSEGGYFLERLIVFYVCEFEGSDEGSETFSAESQVWSILQYEHIGGNSIPKWLFFYEGQIFQVL